MVFMCFTHIISSSKALVSRHREDAPDVPHRCPWSSGDTSRARELWDLLPTARMERDEGTVDLSESTLSDWSRHGGYRRFTIGKWRIDLTFHDQHGRFTIGFTLYLVQDIASLTEDMCHGQNTYYDLWPMNMDEHSPMWVHNQTIEYWAWHISIISIISRFTRNSYVNHWLVVLTILKNISQWEGLSHILWKIKTVPNHQPDHWILVNFLVKQPRWNGIAGMSLKSSRVNVASQVLNRSRKYGDFPLL